jgi:hypothetical protein
MRARHTAIADRLRSRARRRRYGAAGAWWPYRRNQVYLHVFRPIAGDLGHACTHLATPSDGPLVRMNQPIAATSGKEPMSSTSLRHTPSSPHRFASRPDASRRFGPIPSHTFSPQMVGQSGNSGQPFPIATPPRGRGAPEEVHSTVRHRVDEVRLMQQVVAAMENKQGEDHSGATRSRPRPPAGPDAVHSIDVERLTDQVIAAIDRRTISYRERMGKG